MKGFHKAGFTSLVFSFPFMVCPIGYYFICIIFKDDYEEYICDYAEKEEKDKTE